MEDGNLKGFAIVRILSVFIKLEVRMSWGMVWGELVKKFNFMRKITGVLEVLERVYISRRSSMFR